MKEDLHTITLTDNQLELVAIAIQSAFHRAADNNLLADLGDILFMTLIHQHGQESFSDDFDAIDVKIVQPVIKKLKAMAMGEQYT